MRSLLNVSVAAVLTAFGPASAIAGISPSAAIVGTVTLTAAEGGTFAGEGARVTLACAGDGTTRTEVSDERGAFRFLNVPVGSCSIEADVQGFVGQPVRVDTAAQQVVETDLHLGVAPLRVGVNVGGTIPFRIGRRCANPDGLTRVRGSGSRQKGAHARSVIDAVGHSLKGLPCHIEQLNESSAGC